ncbi:MAG: GNAT family N-acetyltransferase, partial [Candidatus Marinimicrobia bacterium]|nr:GNAT family N-acetyltransferase [Candidatus Neomarinimicrobiota bacterium]
NAQEQVVGFYEKLGFNKTGVRFFEADVPHFKMILK